MKNKTLAILFIALAFLAGCSSNKGGGRGQTQTPPEEEFSLVFCGQCSDSDPATIDLCKMKGESFVSCEFSPRCGDASFSNGACETEPICGNGVCETGEETSCTDCGEKIECPGGGTTGEIAVPRNSFEWNFASIKSDSCDSTNPSHYNCDSFQAFISLLSKLQKAREYTETNGTPSETTELEGVGKISPAQNGFEVETEMALLSDNLESTELVKDFLEKLEKEQGALGELQAPTWLGDWKTYLATTGKESALFEIRYKKNRENEPEVFRLNEKLHSRGYYKTTIGVDWQNNSTGFFTTAQDGTTEPRARVSIGLRKTGELFDSVVFDVAFDGELGVENPDRDYGVKWPQGGPTVSLSSTGTAGEKRFDSGIYLSGLNEILVPDVMLSGFPKEPSFFTAPLGITSDRKRENTFFGNAPVFLQTISEYSEATPLGQELGDAKIFEGQQIFVSYNPTMPVPLAAIVSPDSTLVLGTRRLNEFFALPENWVKAAEFGQKNEACSDFEETGTQPVVEKLCGDSDPAVYEEAFGEPFNFSSEEILANYPAGMVLHNASNMQGIYLNIAYVPLIDYLEEPVLLACNGRGEVSSPSGTIAGQGELVLYDQSKKIETLKELFKAIEEEKICVYSQKFAQENTQDNTGFSTAIEKTSYMWNVDKILGEVYPKVYSYNANPELGYFLHCS